MEQQTCGTGLAEHAALPARMSEVVAAMADVLDHHLAALDVSDPDTVPEREAYTSLVGQQREIAAQLEANASEMAGYRRLVMGRHDMDAMSAPEGVRAFERYVSAERGLLVLLRGASEQDQRMLGEMRSATREA